MTYSLIDDLSTLTTIPTTNLNSLIKKSTYIICDNIEESRLKGESIIEINIGIGNLKINIEGNNIQYCFIPNKELDKNIKKTIIENKSPLIELSDKIIINRFLNAYKDFI